MERCEACNQCESWHEVPSKTPSGVCLQTDSLRWMAVIQKGVEIPADCAEKGYFKPKEATP